MGMLNAQGKLEEVRTRIELIHSLGLPAGVASHEPEVLLDIQDKRIPVDFNLVCLYNLTGYRGSTAEPKEEFAFADRAIALAAIPQLNQPCIAYKIYGAGRLTPEQGLADVRKVLRPTDGVLIGMFPLDHTDIVADNVRRIAELPL